jgi:hypothetical protein
MLYNPVTFDMTDDNREIILSRFLSNNGIPVPDNQAPDTEMGSVIKEWMSKTDRGYLAFNMEEALQATRERLREKVEENEWVPDGFVQYVNDIPDDIAVEELPIYRDYLSKFTPGPFFRDKRLLTTADDRISKEDGDLFLKMVCGSEYITYDLVFNEEWERWELTTHHETDEVSISKRIYKLHWTSIKSMFTSLLFEHLMREFFLKKDSRHAKNSMQKEVAIFEQKMQALEAKHNPKPLHDKDIDINAKLEELLKS